MRGGEGVDLDLACISLTFSDLQCERGKLKQAESTSLSCPHTSIL